MKRNKNLIMLSRDHHYGLLLGWKIKQGIVYNVAFKEMAKYCIYFAKTALLPHFEEEENQVLSYLAYDDSYRIRTINEHLEIKAIINELCIEELPDKAILIKLTNMIEKHIRFEERELFPYVESILSSTHSIINLI